MGTIMLMFYISLSKEAEAAAIMGHFHSILPIFFFLRLFVFQHVAQTDLKFMIPLPHE
jgi:hypothetical protein